MQLERSKGNGLRLGLSVSSLRYGVAAAALIGTVLGLHERINAAIVGQGSVAVMQAPLIEPVAAPAESDVVVVPSRMDSTMIAEAVIEELPKPVEETATAAPEKTEPDTQPDRAVSVPLLVIKPNTVPDPLTEGEMAQAAKESGPTRAAVVEAEGDKAKTEIKSVMKKAVKKSVVVGRPVHNKTGQADERVIQGSDWIVAQPGGNFTLQLLATSEQRELEVFVANHPALKWPLGRFEQQRANKRLHVLTQGSYPNREQAETAAKALPDKLQAWIRDFAGITKVMSAPVEAAEMPNIGDIKDTAWVWSQNPNHYTIQLAGAVDEVSIDAVMRGLNLPGELAVVQILRNAKPWYALIYGSFTDRAVAHGTIARLPVKLQKAGPWVRRFSVLQSEISQAGAR